MCQIPDARHARIHLPWHSLTLALIPNKTLAFGACGPMFCTGAKASEWACVTILLLLTVKPYECEGECAWRARAYHTKDERCIVGIRHPYAPQSIHTHLHLSIRTCIYSYAPASIHTHLHLFIRTLTIDLSTCSLTMHLQLDYALAA